MIVHDILRKHWSNFELWPWFDIKAAASGLISFSVLGKVYGLWQCPVMNNPFFGAKKHPTKHYKFNYQNLNTTYFPYVSKGLYLGIWKGPALGTWLKHRKWGYQIFILILSAISNTTTRGCRLRYYSIQIKSKNI